MPSVIWYGSRTLKFEIHNRTQDLRLQARVLSEEIDVIDWILSSGEFGFSQALTTFWTADPLAELENRFGAFADALPQIFQDLTNP